MHTETLFAIECASHYLRNRAEALDGASGERRFFAKGADNVVPANIC
jgi:hypothetical protein